MLMCYTGTVPVPYVNIYYLYQRERCSRILSEEIMSKEIDYSEKVKLSKDIVRYIDDIEWK